jgi:hypothetical protein
MIRWLLIAIALTTVSGCTGFRGASSSGSSSHRALPMTSEIREVPVPTDRSTYMWADPL